MNKEANLYNIMEQFAIGSKIAPYGTGHINGTYSVEVPRLLLQRINTDVFKNPDELMENIETVTEFLRKKIIAAGGDPERETLRIIKTVDGRNYYRDEEDNVYRMYRFVEDTKIIVNEKTYDDLYHAGKGFGHFQQMLSDFPVDVLHETIQDFHHTPKRVEALKAAIAENKAGRASGVETEIAFALEHAKIADVVVSRMETGEVPVRVTHNDTKIDNILFDRETGEAICVIDLDTVMPGSMLYDFGDALRMGASTGAEDEVDLSKVCFDKEAFRAFAKGYLEELGADLTEAEIELLPISAALLTYECGIRFLTDYLNGDTYFKIHRENHNLDRARNQFKLVTDILELEEELKAIVAELR
ncbi:MAG: aminoglycoside phosphotransferase family protein [Lachnospiraceae bacterium]|nr:aminoglycoside phosphotransferase family protein [Lachnospiraceae bacterium]